MQTTEQKEETKEEERVSGTLIQGGRYVEAIGRRKRASARVRIWEEKGAKKSFLVNEREMSDYFPTESTRETAKDALAELKAQNRFTVSAYVKGSGVAAQADAVRHGLARALASLDIEWKRKLKKAGFLKPDIRIVERKKFGKKKARKSPQWSKR